MAWRWTVVVLALLLPAQALAEGARYLIIGPDQFEAALEPLVEWKSRKGMSARFVPLNECGFSSTEIQSYIRDAHDTWDPAPEYILLAGSANQVQMPMAGSGQSDTPFGDLDGDGFVDIHPGRFPADTSEQIELMVEKVLEYERYPTQDPSFYRTAVMCVGEDDDDDDWLHYFADAAYATALMSDSGYDDVRLVTRMTSSNASAELTSALEDGASWATYHGQVSGPIGWYGFNIEPDDIANGPMLPVILSYTCDTMIGGEKWLRAGEIGDPRGGVVFVGQTVSCSYCADWRSALRRGFWEHTFETVPPDQIVTFGESVEAGRIRYYNEFLQMQQYYASTIYGDPELNLWTSAPMRMEVSHPSALPRGETTFSVAVCPDGNPREGVAIGLWSAEGQRAHGTTDDCGEVTFTIDTSADSVVFVTGTGRDLFPYEGEMPVGGDPVASDDDDDTSDDETDDDAAADDDYTTEPTDDADITGGCECSASTRTVPVGAALIFILALIRRQR